jgi:hypothetical protein
MAVDKEVHDPSHRVRSLQEERVVGITHQQIKARGCLKYQDKNIEMLIGFLFCMSEELGLSC